MAEKQLRLFGAGRPLVERLGKDFFRRIPHRAGVYLMSDGTGRIVYVGQSKDLRARLTSYRSVNPDRDSRKVVRLVQVVEGIQWEECGSAEEAMLRENQLLREHRPKFNRVNTYPAAYLFLTLKVEGGRVMVVLGRDVGSMGEMFGAFKARAVAGYAALSRTLWGVGSGATSLDQFPCRLLTERPPRRFAFDFNGERPGVDADVLGTELSRFLGGESNQLLEWFKARLPEPGSVFQQQLQEADLETLATFYKVGPKRNQILSERFGLGRRLIQQAELDDLLVRGKGANADCQISISD